MAIFYVKNILGKKIFKYSSRYLGALIIDDVLNFDYIRSRSLTKLFNEIFDHGLGIKYALKVY